VRFTEGLGAADATKVTPPAHKNRKQREKQINFVTGMGNRGREETKNRREK
jgi:hypothetical protein